MTQVATCNTAHKAWCSQNQCSLLFFCHFYS